MAKQTINIGASPNDGTGTPLRTSFDYCNLNFTELYTATGPSGNNIVVPGNATITGDLTVDTSTLKVDSTNNRVGVNNASPSEALDVSGNGFFRGDVSLFSSTGGAVVSKSLIFGSAANTSVASIYGQTNSATAGQLFLATETGGVMTERLGISDTGVFTFQNVGNVAGTAMTLNSIGLGLGAVPAGVARFVVFNGATQALTLDTSGNFLLGKTVSGAFTDGCQLFPAGTISIGHPTGTGSGAAYSIFAYNSVKTGDITQNGTTGVLYNTVSDYRLKESVKPISNGLARVNSLKPSSYNWKSDGSVGEGFIAHELAEMVPAAVSGEKDAVNADGSINAQSVDMSRIVPILVAAIQELTARVQTLEAR